MLAGPRHVVGVATIVIVTALAVPAVAGASGGGKCNASACKVYHEQQGPSAGSGQQPPQQQAGGSTQTGSKPNHAPKGLTRVLARAGHDKGPLSHLLTGAGLGSLRNGSGDVGSPGLLGAALDLGAGPTVLLAILLATGLGLAARGSVGGWLRKRSSS